MSVINIKKGKRKSAGGDTPAEAFVDAPVIQPSDGTAAALSRTATLAEMRAYAIATGDRFGAYVYGMADVKPLDKGYLPIREVLYDVGCGECHRSDTLRLVMRDGGHRLGHAIFRVACGADGTIIDIPIDVVAVTRMAPTQFLPTVMRTIDDRCRAAGWERWPEREDGLPAIRLKPELVNALHRLLSADVITSISALRPVIAIHGVPMFSSVYAPKIDIDPVPLLDLVNVWSHRCAWCGAPNYWRCDPRCTRPETAITKALIYRAPTP